MTYKIYSNKYGEFRKEEYETIEQAQKAIDENPGDAEEIINKDICNVLGLK